LLEEADPETLIGDKAYDADPLLDTLAQREITPVIPPKANRKTPRTCDFALYCERNLQQTQALSSYRHTLRQTGQKFPRRCSTGLRYHSPQLKTGPSQMDQETGGQNTHIHA
jgi:hypothetical protein